MLGKTGTAFLKEVKTGGTNRRTAGSHARRSTGTGLAIRFSTGYRRATEFRQKRFREPGKRFKEVFRTDEPVYMQYRCGENRFIEPRTGTGESGPETTPEV